MDLSFHEKSLRLMTASLLAFAVFYFGATLPSGAVDVTPDQMLRFTVAIVCMVVFQIAGHILISVADRRSGTDERDRRIALEGSRNGACVLATGVFCALCAALLTKGNFLFTHVLLGFWVLAQLVEYGTQIVLQRRAI